MAATLHIVPLYAALLALLFIGLSLNVVRGRRAHQVSIGDGGDAGLAQNIRIHANFAEYVPLALILLTMMELRGASATLLHLLGVALLAARLAHVLGLSGGGNLPARAAGVVATFSVIIAAALLLLLT